jgi:cytochrome bd-type quinol oxidase subunit 2
VRVIVSASAIVFAFFLGAWTIAVLLPDTPDWSKVALCLVWLFVLIGSAFILGNKKGSTQEEKREFRHVVRENLSYLGLALLPIVFLVALEIHDLDKGIHRNVRQNWLLCTITAGTVVGLSIEKFWRIRRYWETWAVLAAYATLHFCVGIPALAHLQSIRYGYISMIAMPELLLIFSVLDPLQAKHSQSLRNRHYAH